MEQAKVEIMWTNRKRLLSIGYREQDIVKVEKNSHLNQKININANTHAYINKGVNTNTNINVNSNVNTNIITTVYYGENGFIELPYDAKIREGYTVQEVALVEDDDVWILYQCIPQASICTQQSDIKDFISSRLFFIRSKSIINAIKDTIYGSLGFGLISLIVQSIIRIFVRYDWGLIFGISFLFVLLGLVSGVYLEIGNMKRYKKFQILNTKNLSALDQEYNETIRNLTIAST